MKRSRLRLLALSGVVVSTVPSVLVLLAVRSEAAPAVFGQYATTAIVRATSTDGNIGASGGLTPLDSGSASIDAALDNSPTAMVLARPVEPGTTYATVSSLLPVTVPVPEASAAYPGTKTSATSGTSPSPNATATVTQTSAVGTAADAGSTASGTSVGAVTASASLGATGGGHLVSSVADAYVSGFSVAGVLDITGVRGHAEISASADGKRSASATIVVGSITVAGQPVIVDDTGVHAVGSTLPLGPTLAQLSSSANAALAGAGISVSLLNPSHSVTTTSLGSHAAADSGGLSVTITTPTIGNDTVPANIATVTLGRVQLTESDAPSEDLSSPVTPPGVTTPSAPGSVAQPGIPGTPGVPGRIVTVPGAQGSVIPPSVAQPGALVPAAREVVIAGHHVSPAAALSALGGWEALTLGAASFAMIALRGDGGAGGGDDEEELLCPCPA